MAREPDGAEQLPGVNKLDGDGGSHGGMVHCRQISKPQRRWEQAAEGVGKAAPTLLLGSGIAALGLVGLLFAYQFLSARRAPQDLASCPEGESCNAQVRAYEQAVLSDIPDLATDWFEDTPTVSRTPGPPSVTLLQDARCRLGPGFDYPTVTYLPHEASFAIVGRLQQGGWWQIRAHDLDQPCWIGEDIVEPSGDLTAIPVAIPPELPTKESTQVPPQGCWCRNNPQQQCEYTAPCPSQPIPCTPPKP